MMDRLAALIPLGDTTYASLRATFAVTNVAKKKPTGQV